jgi:hypothetical protein
MNDELSPTDIDAVARFVAGWWAARLQQGDRELFKESLLGLVTAHLLAHPERPHLMLECDYDPRGPLLDAVRAAGIECRGVMFSGDGILPRKHSTDIFPARKASPEFDEQAQPARLVLKEGYGNWRDPIPLADIIAGRVTA